MNRQRLVVVLANKIQIFDLESMRVLATLDTVHNPRGLCVLSPNDKASHLVFPSSTSAGELLVYNALSLGVLNVLKAHLKPMSALAISQCGSRLATASETVSGCRRCAVGGRCAVQLTVPGWLMPR